MKLMTKKIEKAFERVPSRPFGEKAKIIVKFFCNQNGWCWYATGYNRKTKEFYGFVKGNQSEWGPFSLKEFEEVNEKLGYSIIQRDRWFRPGHTVQDVMAGKVY